MDTDSHVCRLCRAVVSLPAKRSNSLFSPIGLQQKWVSRIKDLLDVSIKDRLANQLQGSTRYLRLATLYRLGLMEGHSRQTYHDCVLTIGNVSDGVNQCTVSVCVQSYRILLHKPFTSTSTAYTFYQSPQMIQHLVVAADGLSGL